MENTTRPACPRLEIRNLNAPQKCLIFVLLAGIGFGYLGALVHLFVSSAGADSKQTITIEEVADVFQKNGLQGVLTEVQNSLGLDDVIKTYYGSGPGITRMEAALHGVMKPILMEELGDKNVPKEDTEKDVALISQPLIEWSHLPKDLRKKAYDEGMPIDNDGNPDFKKFIEVFGAPVAANANKANIDLEPVIGDLLDGSCVHCHSGQGAVSQFPLETFDEVDVYAREDRGMSYKQLALTTHVHLLGFSMLFALTGFLFSMTSYPLWLRLPFVPWTLGFQLIEIACWWLAKSNIYAAHAIFYLGPVIAIGLGVQILGTLFELLFRRPTCV